MQKIYQKYEEKSSKIGHKMNRYLKKMKKIDQKFQKIMLKIGKKCSQNMIKTIESHEKLGKSRQYRKMHKINF